MANQQGSPDIQQIQGMRAQGFTNNQIIQSLQRDGYSSAQIFDAMNQADMAGQEHHPGPQGPSFTPDPGPSTLPFGGPEPAPHSSRHMSTSPDLATSEELIEAIIDEKWNELVRDINKIIDWKTKTESKIAALQQQFQDLKDQFDRLHQAVVGKIGEYDKNILEVGSEIKAMEKVFSKVLPVFTDNVNELSRITDSFKRRR